MDIVVSTHGLTKRYKDKAVVNQADITVRKGEIYGLVGRNGAGKTTLLRMICGLTPISDGTLALFGQGDAKRLTEERRRIGAIIETPSFYPYLSARDNLEYYRILRGIPEKEVVSQMLNLVGLQDTGKKKFKSFSLGMKQKLGFALAMMGNPDFLVLDEPTNGLDPMGIIEFRQMLQRISRERGTTILVSSHILSELSQMATCYAFIENGRIIEEVTAKEIAARCRQSVEVQVDDAPRAAAILENEMDCTDYEVLNDNRIRVYQYIETPELITKGLVLNGVLVQSATTTGVELESYYMNLVGGASYA
ncbi:ABC transporter ATP-binding protein [Eubacteriales bacterium OttesenSCG-928-M02]|nr:ABC transporter ATP-binding protein [Eubacteriales bacterium OttesenSCG-928-M02]